MQKIFISNIYLVMAIITLRLRSDFIKYKLLIEKYVLTLLNFSLLFYFFYSILIFFIFLI